MVRLPHPNILILPVEHGDPLRHYELHLLAPTLHPPVRPLTVRPSMLNTLLTLAVEQRRRAARGSGTILWFVSIASVQSVYIRWQALDPIRVETCSYNDVLWVWSPCLTTLRWPRRVGATPHLLAPWTDGRILEAI